MRVSLTRPAPVNSPRLGTKQGYTVERCDVSSLPIFCAFYSPVFLSFACPKDGILPVAEKDLLVRGLPSTLLSFCPSKRKKQRKTRGYISISCFLRLIFLTRSEPLRSRIAYLPPHWKITLENWRNPYKAAPALSFWGTWGGQNGGNAEESILTDTGFHPFPVEDDVTE